MTVLRKIIGILLITGMLFGVSTLVYADMTPLPRVPRCVRIDNLDEWPGYYLIGLIFSIEPDAVSPPLLLSADMPCHDVCISQGTLGG